MAIRNGTPGDDILYGTIGNDTINGYAGNDTVYNRGGTDIIDAGDGDDVVYVFNPPSSSALLNVFGGSGYDALIVSGSIGVDYHYSAVPTYGSFEKVMGSDGNDSIFATYSGTLQDLTFIGRGGNDRITGSLGNDILNGGTGDDEISGNPGNDRLTGGDGIDKLFGDQGFDIVTGGGGSDRFVFRKMADFAGMTAATCDRIRDFSQAEHDRILLGGIDANTTNDGPGHFTDDTFTFIATAAFSHTPGELRYEVIHGNTYVMGDVNGDAQADFWFRLNGEHTLTAADFVL